MRKGREKKRSEKRKRKTKKTRGEKRSRRKNFYSPYLERRDSCVDRLRRRVLDAGLGVAGSGAGRLAGLGRGLELGAEGLLGGLFLFFFSWKEKRERVVVGVES